MGLEAFPPGLKVLRFSACPLLDSGAFMECVGFRIQRVGGFVFFFFYGVGRQQVVDIAFRALGLLAML